MTVPDILKKVLDGLDVDLRRSRARSTPRDYCVQYRETDFAFASRLMEEEGIFYFFKHTADGHKMVVANTPAEPSRRARHEPASSSTASDGGRATARTAILDWEKTQELRSGKYTLWDHCFELPHKHLEAGQDRSRTASRSARSTHKLKVGGNDKLEIYDYPGGYAQRFDGVDPGGGDRPADLQKIFEDNERTVEHPHAGGGGARPGDPRGERRAGTSSAGTSSRSSEHFNADGDYVLTGVEHAARLSTATTAPGSESGASTTRTASRCIPLGAAVPARRGRRRRPTVQGTQTAVVVGPPGEEIFTDKYGRVKVQFHWDREGKNDADSSCWVRVGTPWAGKQWGDDPHPADRPGGDRRLPGGRPRPADHRRQRLQRRQDAALRAAGQQDPERRQDAQQPWTATADNFNELRFEDKKGAEQIYFHAEKDFNRVVENNDDLKVGDDQRSRSAQRPRTEGPSRSRQRRDGHAIEQGQPRRETVDEGNDTHHVKKGNREVRSTWATTR